LQTPSIKRTYPPLKEVGVLEGSNPLILACHYGDSVERIVEGWGADVNEAGVY